MTGYNQTDMTEYIQNFVSGHGIKFNRVKNDSDVFEKAEQQWQQIAEDLNINADSVVMVCGPKNNGKSSLLRYLINKYNAESKTASYYIDCDPGQPEMTTAGIVSAHVIHHQDAPLTSPSYLNVSQHECLLQSCVGGTNVSVNPRVYVENCQFVYESAKNHRRDSRLAAPIFINTMGFVRNVGLAILMDLIKLFRPTDFVVLNVENDPTRIVHADLSSNFVNSLKPSFFVDDLDSTLRKEINYNYHIYNLEFSFVDSSSVANKNRSALQLAYLASMTESLYKPLLDQNPKYLDLDKILIHCVSSYPLKEQIILELLIHSWVHLVKLRYKHFPMKNQDNKYCRIVEVFHENILHGCGIISGIDLDNKRISIITPLNQKQLDESVDCLIKPMSIQVPVEVMQ